MGVLSQTRLGQVLHAISQGFVQTPIEVLVFFVIIAALLLFFRLSYVIRKRRAEEKLGKHESEMINHRLDELDLTDEQMTLLDRLALSLRPCRGVCPRRRLRRGISS